MNEGHDTGYIHHVVLSESRVCNHHAVMYPIMHCSQADPLIGKAGIIFNIVYYELVNRMHIFLN